MIVSRNLTSHTYDVSTAGNIVSAIHSDYFSEFSALLIHYLQVEQAILYGSRAVGTYRNGSDIDLTLYGEALTFSTLNKIINDLDSLDLPFTIDLSIFTNISDPDIIDHIRRVGVTFYKRQSEQVKVS